MRYIFFSFLFFITLACDDADQGMAPSEQTPSNSINKIMPLGASRVEGARPDFESYRYELWKLLLDNNYEFDFIGTRDDEDSYPSYAGMNFDLDHEGRGGWTSGQILSGVESWVDAAGTPDIVLFSSPGGNDALTGQSYEQAIANINAIIDILQNANPNVTILIEQLAPGQSEIMRGQLATFFEKMQQDVSIIATEQTTSISKVIPVDMATGFNDNLLADDVHYNEAGAKFIADRYYEVLTTFLEEN